MKLNIPHSLKLYEVKKIPLKEMEITGKGESAVWKIANTMTDFSYPWNSGTPPSTTFKAVWDSEYLFFNFTVEDYNIITNNSAVNQNTQVMESDRVELFFKSDEELIKPYYCLEMDSTARILSSKSHFYRQHEFSWKWPGENPIILKSSLTNNGYVVEGALAINALNSLNLLINNCIHIGVYRANFIRINDKLEPNWISWIIPKSDKPDFHIPSSFGIFKLAE